VPYIQDLLATKQSQLFIAPKRQSVADQFSKEDCFETMRIANVRIQVERANRRVKGWHVFDQVPPVSWSGKSLRGHLFSFSLPTGKL